MCEYQFHDGSFCQDQPFEDSNYCILHTPMPEDKESWEWRRISNLKQHRFEQEIVAGNGIFNGAKFGNLDFRREISHNVNFDYAKFFGDVLFINATFSGYISFNHVKFSGKAEFSDAKFSEKADFDKAIFSGDAYFNGAKFSGEADFDRAIFSGNAEFNNAKFSGYTDFFNATFSGYVMFENTTFSSNVSFVLATFSGDAFFSVMVPSGFMSLSNSTLKADIGIKNSIIFNLNINNLKLINENCSIRITHSEIGRGVTFDILKIGSNSKLELVGTKITGDLELRQTVIEGTVDISNLMVTGNIHINPENIKNSYARENIFRKMKTHMAEMGHKDISDEYFYQEKVARKRTLWLHYVDAKNSLPRFSFSKKFIQPLIKTGILLIKWFLEWPMHWYFQYGVYPLRTLIIWFLIISGFALIFWQLDLIEEHPSFLAALYFSITNAMTPGYGKFNLIDGNLAYFIATFEALFGAFTWGCFLTIFARKYMDR